MIELKQLFDSLGFQNPRTYLQSGNIVFDHHVAEQAKLAGRIKNALDKSFGLDIAIFIRSGIDIRKLIEGNPFRGKDEKKLHVTFLSKPGQMQNIDKIKKVVGPGEAFFVAEEEVYLFCPNGYARTKLSNTFLEGLFKTQATTRSWNTICALSVIAGMSKKPD